MTSWYGQRHWRPIRISLECEFPQGRGLGWFLSTISLVFKYYTWTDAHYLLPKWRNSFCQSSQLHLSSTPLIRHNPLSLLDSEVQAGPQAEAALSPASRVCAWSFLSLKWPLPTFPLQDLSISVNIQGCRVQISKLFIRQEWSGNLTQYYKVTTFQDKIKIKLKKKKKSDQPRRQLGTQRSAWALLVKLYRQVRGCIYLEKGENFLNYHAASIRARVLLISGPPGLLGPYPRAA